MVNSGLNKFLQYMPMPEMSAEAGALMGAFAEAAYLFPLVGFVELVAGLMLFTKRFNALGAVLMMPITVNIFMIHTVLDPAGFVMGSVLLLLNIWFLYDNKEKFHTLVA